MNDIAEANENVISQAFEHTRKDLESDLGRTESLIGQAKLPQLKYSDAIRVDVPYSTRMTNRLWELTKRTRRELRERNDTNGGPPASK